jgi:hypothetical protein
MGTGHELVRLLIKAPIHVRERELRELGPQACQVLLGIVNDLLRETTDASAVTELQDLRDAIVAAWP